MRKIFFLWGILLCFLSANAQTQYPSISPTVTFTSATPIYSNDPPTTITAQGETADMLIDLPDGGAPQVYGTPKINSPTDGSVSASNVNMSNMTVVTAWSASGHKSTFSANVTNTNSKAVNVTFTLLVTSLDINNPVQSIGFCTVTYTVTVNPGTKPPTSYGNDAQTGPWYTQGCGVGFTGGTMAYTVPMNTYYASTKLAANNLAKAAGQTYINTHTTCVALFGNQATQGLFYSKSCVAGTYAATPVIYPVPANKYYAATLGDANAQAAADITANGQTYANNSGPAGCAILPAPVIQTALSTADGTTINLTLSNTTAPMATNALEVIAVDNSTSQVYTNVNGTSSTASIAGLTPGRMYTVTVVVFDTQHNSTDNTSAPKQVQMFGTAPPLITYQNQQQSGTFIKNTCGSGYQGSSVTLTVPPNTVAYNSFISVADANSKALAYINGGAGQANADNSPGNCTLLSGVPTFTVAYGGHSGIAIFTVTPNIPNAGTSVLYSTDTTTGQSGSSAGAPGGWTTTLTDGHTYQFYFVCYGGGTPSTATSATQTFYMP
jgi:hypothetical protein